MESLRQRGVTYSALVASNDDMAIGAMKQLHQLGVKVPEQVSVVGFDDIALRRIWCRRSPASGCR